LKIALFEPDWRSPKSLMISYLTKTPWSHAAVEIDGVWYDASESRGDFSQCDVKKKMKGRLAHVWRIGNRIAVRNKIEENLGTRYEYKGLLGYALSSKKDKRFYCFELAMVMALLVKEPKAIPMIEQINGLDILGLLGKPTEVITF